jgi:hypothetical protein
MKIYYNLIQNKKWPHYLPKEQIDVKHAKIKQHFLLHHNNQTSDKNISVTEKEQA